MKKLLKSLVAVGYLSIFASAQYGTAPTGYYPDGYTGAVFTGVVTGATADQITLSFTKGSRTETFTASFEAGCAVPTTQKGGPLMMPADIPTGTEMTAFFEPRTRKLDGKKIKENVVFAVAFDSWQGHKIPEDKKKVYPCTDHRHFTFKAFQ